MSTWHTLEIPIIEAPVHDCEKNGRVTGLFYQRTIVVRQHEGHIEHDLFLMKQFNLKLYICHYCQKQFGVRE